MSPSIRRGELKAGIAAFFDIDGTLLPPPSLERQFRSFLRWRGELDAQRQFCSLARFLALVWRDPLAATHGNKLHYAGVRLTTVQAWLSFLRRHPLPFYLPALDCLRWHAKQGHCIVLVSGTIRPLADFVAESLSSILGARLVPSVSIEVLATELEAQGSRFTGQVVGRAVCGAQKASAIKTLTAAQHLNLAESYAYGNSILDRWMLVSVGHPAAANPSFLLERLARRRGWPILRWSHTARPYMKRPSYATSRSTTPVPPAREASQFQEDAR
jgi:HAD superfamily phosphoserine phosphatase-like hydrolase